MVALLQSPQAVWRWARGRAHDLPLLLLWHAHVVLALQGPRLPAAAVLPAARAWAAGPLGRGAEATWITAVMALVHTPPLADAAWSPGLRRWLLETAPPDADAADARTALASAQLEPTLVKHM
jgi:hypothetical protein